MMTWTWENQFGAEYAVPPQISEHPLMEDASWNQDMCPSFILKGHKYVDGALSLWVEHPDVTRHELMAKRFLVTHGGQDVLETDDLAAAIAKFEEIAKQQNLI